MVVVAVGCVSIQFIKLSIPIRFRNNIYTMHVCGMRIGNAQSSTGLPGKTNIGFRSDQGRPANGKPAHSVPLPGPTRLPKFSVNTHRHVEFGRTCNLLVHGKQLCVQSSRLDVTVTMTPFTPPPSTRICRTGDTRLQQHARQGCG